MRQMLSAVVALSTLLAAPFWARADVIYSNLGVGDAYGVFAGYTISGPNSSSLPAHTQAVAFTPVQDAFVGTIELLRLKPATGFHPRQYQWRSWSRRTRRKARSRGRHHDIC